MPKNALAGWLSRQHRIVLAWIVVPSVVFGSIALVLAFWPISTQVAMQVQAQSVQFSPAADTTGVLWEGSLKFAALDIQGLQKLSVPGDWPLTENGQPTNTISNMRDWLGAESPLAELHITTAGWLSEVKLAPETELRLEAIGNRQFTLRWLDKPQTLLIVPIGQSQIQGHHLHRTALDKPRLDDLNLQLNSPPSQPFELGVKAGGTLTVRAETVLLLPHALPVGQLAFKEQTRDGAAVCSLRGELKLRYPDFPERKELTLPAPSNCEIQSDRDNPLQLSGLHLNEKGDGWMLTITGSAAELKLGRDDYRINALEALWANDLAKIIFAIVVWVASLALGAYKLHKEESKS
ncbi:MULTISPECIES: hypothetical protein [Methylomonas]|nr:hypothetical protein [Methylomonas koyamae]